MKHMEPNTDVGDNEKKNVAKLLKVCSNTFEIPVFLNLSILPI